MKKIILYCSFICLFYYQISASMLDGYVNQFLQNSFDILNNSNLANKEKKNKISNLLLENLDLKWIVNFLLGSERHKISSEELADFREIYKDYIIQNLSKIIEQYNGQKVKIKSIRNIKNKDYLVRTMIMKNNESGNISVDIMIREVDDNVFQIFDIVTEGVSLLITQKQDFNIILQDNTLGKEKIKKLIFMLRKAK